MRAGGHPGVWKGSRCERELGVMSFDDEPELVR